MEKTDVLIIGGGPAGIITAVTGKSFYPDKKFLLIRKEKQVVVPCGIPYVFGSIKNTDMALISDSVLNKSGIELKIDTVVTLDKEKKSCKTQDGSTISFEKLVLALGSHPYLPEWLEGANLENVFTIPKNKEYLDRILIKLKECKKVVVIGGGFIGVEVSDELNKIGKDVTIIEILPHILGNYGDIELTIPAEDILKSRGIKIINGIGIKEIIGNTKVTGVLLENGETLESDIVFLTMGYKPNSELVQKAGIRTNSLGFVKVDEYMRTFNPDIFAVGDCAEKIDFITRRPSNLMLASTACAEARIAGMNLYKLCGVKIFNGTIAIFSTAIGNIGFGTAGLSERLARDEGFDIITDTFEGIDKHPKALDETHKQIVKLIVSCDSGVILGGEVMGGASTGELINLIGLAIQNRMTVNQILTSQVGTHPLLTGPPTAYPLIKVAEVIAMKLKLAK